ncbi:hypothetical protein [Natronincola ferrireducens]|nr:hypothetical protein [Natronincola ferrireducens]
MPMYTFELINKDPSLDLTLELNNINEAINYILEGKNRRNPVFIDVDNIRINRITQYRMELDVELGEDANDSWKQKIGWYLANKCDMRNYCNSANAEEMFKIS